MVRNVIHVCASACILLFGSACLAQNNSWNGSWKADPNSMKFEGTEFTFTPDAGGFTVSMGGEAQPKVICDSSPHDVEGVMVTCEKTADGYHLTRTREAQKIAEVTLSVAPDGRTLIRKAEQFPKDGEPYTMTMYANRVSGGPGTAGVWKQERFTESQDTGVLSINVHGDEIDFKETDQAKPLTVKLDGTPASLGPASTVSIRLADPNTLKVTYANNGKTARENTFALSRDGRTITETDVTPAPGQSRMTLKLTKM